MSSPTRKRLSLERAAMRGRLLMFVAMIAAVALVGVTLYLDARREAAAALADFAREQAALADAVAAQVDERSMWSMTSLEKPGALLIVARGSDGVLRRPDGTTVVSAPIASAIDHEERTVRLTRPEASAIGLPTRTAVGGISRAKSGRAVVVVATALRVRDREIRAQNRLLLGIVLAAVLVGIFGGIALRIQRKELLLERELLVKEAEMVSNERLARADKLATMGAFATGIAHEIATPLGVIVARTEMLAPPSAEDRGARAARAILEQTEKIRGIIKSFLAVARGEAQTQARIAPRELLMSAKAMVEHRFDAASIALDVAADATLPTLLGEPRLLEQALVNLLLNACDASKPGKTVRAVVRVEDDRVCFCIEDDGPGIRPEVAARATEPFFTTKPEGAGTGLGLAIANEIAKHHQGRFVIRARSPNGTEARLELPIAGSSPKERAA